MEIKRNIFDSSARMPRRYEPVATAQVQDDAHASFAKLSGAVKYNHDVVHARSPRIGDK